MKTKILDDTPKVNEYMSGVEHPLKAEVEAVRAIMLNVNKGITEGIKWNSPTIYYKGDMVVFHLRSTDYVHLIFPTGDQINDSSGLLEGDYKDGRRMAYFHDMKDVEAKKAALENVVRTWMKLKDA